MSNIKKLRILVVGGVAGGATFSARARRLNEEAEIIIFERDEYISFANCGLPYHIGKEIACRDALLLQTPEAMKQRYNIDVRVKNEVIAINREEKNIVVKNLLTNQTYQENYDVLVLSPGANPFIPPIEGISKENIGNSGIFTLRNMQDMDNINQWLESNDVKNAVVVGGGYIGLEMIEALHNRHVSVDLIELAPQVMGVIDQEMATLIHNELAEHGVKLHLNSALKSIFKQQNSNKMDVNFVHNATTETLTTDLIILAIGVKPEITLAKNAGLEIGKLGGIVVNEYLKTNDENIYAIGDAIEIKDFTTEISALIPLAGPANRQGRIVADNIFSKPTKYKSTQGTGICKVFDLTVGTTGVNEKILCRNNLAYEKIYLHSNDHASYYPHATPITCKVLFNLETGKIYGVQAIGLKGVDKRIDVFASAIRNKLTVFDLQDLELSYAPPFGSAKDLINYAGFIAENVIHGTSKICHTSYIDKNQDAISRKDIVLLDVRTPDEFTAGTIPNAINFPLDELRQRLHELPQDKEFVVFCKVGLRGYLACRILQQHNFACKNLSGGYKTYLLHHPADNSAKNVAEKDFATNNPFEDQQIFDLKSLKANCYIDAISLQCPGPIQKLGLALNKLQNGEIIEIITSDKGFLNDAKSWCEATNNTFLGSMNEGLYQQKTFICKGTNQSHIIQASNQPFDIKDVPSKDNKNMTIVVFSGDLDKVLASFIIANGAVAMGFKPTLFFTFWGLNALRKDNPPTITKTFIEKIFGYMMPRGAKKLALSKMHFCGMGTAMIKQVMRQKNVTSLSELISMAQENNVQLIACNMTMELMGIKLEELIDGVKLGGVATYIQNASHGGINLFI